MAGGNKETTLFRFLDELNDFIEVLKQYTEDEMKIEMAPWVKNHTVSMDELYTKLTLEQIENKPTGQIPIKLESYSELFTEKETADKQQSHSETTSEPPRKESRKSKGKKGKKILGKGDPGIGKSTFGRKIAYDWAKGVFTAVSVVFFISMKFIRPGQTIENIIIEQVPPLEALEMGERKLKSILNCFGDKCLIILDGLDEHDLGSSEDVRKIIEGRKLMNCNIILTSRAHDIEAIEKYFSTHVSIKGFSRDHASQFISRCIHDSKKSEIVLDFCVRNFSHQLPSQAFFSPMLILFMIILMKSTELDLTLRKAIPLSEIYFRVVRCIYRNYCERTKKEFQESQFLGVLKRVGKLAWKMLKSGKGWAKKSEILREVGDDAFAIGLLIGDKDFRLSGDETADILIIFPHLNLQVFLGSFGFLQMLNDGQSIETLLSGGYEGQQMLERHTLLQFCLWFLNEKNEYFEFNRRQDILDSLTSHCASQVNLVQLDMMDLGKMFPVLQIPTICIQENIPTLYFIRGILSKCSKTVEFYLRSISIFPVDYLSELIPSLPPHPLEPDNQANTKLCSVLETTSNLVGLQKSSIFCEEAGLHPSFFLSCDSDIDLSKVVLQSGKQLTLFGPQEGVCRVLVGEELPLCPFLENLSFVNLHVDVRVLVALETAVRTGRLPLLRHLSLEGCGHSLTGNLTTLFNSTWAQLTSLNLDKCSLSSTDLTTLSNCLSAKRNRKLPNLTSLVLCSGEGLKKVFLKPLQNISTLALHDANRDDYEIIAKATNAGKLPNLTHLTISFPQITSEILDNTQDVIKTSLKFRALNHLTLNRCVSSPSNINIVVSGARNSEVTKLDISHSSGIAGSLSVMLKEHFLSLTSLVISDCGLTSDDLSNLAQASSEVRLPELKHLDISDNERIRGHLRHLCSFDQQWSHLLSLNVKQAAVVAPGNEFNELLNLARLGALVNLQHLICTANDIDTHLTNRRNIKWPSVQILDVHCAHRHGSSDHVQLYQQLTDITQNSVFPNLNTLSVTSQIIPKHAVSRATDRVFVSDQLEASIEAVNLQDIRDVSSSLIVSHLPADESHLKYLLELTNVNSALDKALEQTITHFITKVFGAISGLGDRMVGDQLAENVLHDVLHEQLDCRDMSDRERATLRSLRDAVISKMRAFRTSGDSVDIDLQTICRGLQQYIDTIPDISELDLSLLKSLAEIGCRNVQCALNGKPLELQPVCPLLQDWINCSPHIPDPFRHLLKSVVDAVQSVLVQNHSNFQSASSVIYHWIDNDPDLSAPQRSMFKFIADVFCTFLNCFFTKPLDLEPVRTLLFEWVDHPADEFVDLCQSPESQFIFKYVVDINCAFVESFCNKKSYTDPMSTVIQKWFERIPDLLESNPTINKGFVCFLQTIFQHIFMKPLGMIDESFDLGLFLANINTSKDVVQEYLTKLFSTQAMHQKNLKKLRNLRHKLRLRGIRVYEHFIPVER